MVHAAHEATIFHVDAVVVPESQIGLKFLLIDPAKLIQGHASQLKGLRLSGVMWFF